MARRLNLAAERNRIVRLPLSTDNCRINRVIGYIEAKYSSILDLTEASEAAGVAPAYLSRLFKNVTGIGFTDYCLSYRMNRAAELLEDTDLAVASVAAMVGCPSASYFCKVFRRLSGMTAVTYRLALRKGSSAQKRT